jgi:hypothetical protein
MLDVLVMFRLRVSKRVVERLRPRLILPTPDGTSVRIDAPFKAIGRAIVHAQVCGTG